MMIHFRSRDSKPRAKGITIVLDKGLDYTTFNSLIYDYHELIDVIKFGWGTALLSNRINEKLSLCRQYSIEPMLGGTLYEYCMITDQMDNFNNLLDSQKIKIVEVSNGAGMIKNTNLMASIKSLSKERQIFHEVGLKNPVKSNAMTTTEWITQISEGMHAGASMTILESRESGRAGICDDSGKLKASLTNHIVSNYGTSKLIFEAPSSSLQGLLINAYGPDINLGNVDYIDIVGVESLRLGLRYDTLSTNSPIQ